MATIGIRVERAFEGLIDALGIEGMQIYRGINNETKDAPATIVTAVSATEEFLGSGLYHVKTQIMVRHLASDTDPSDAEAQAGQIFKACVEADLAALGVFGQLVIFGLFVESNEQDEIDDCWQQVLSLDVVCAIGE
jgi:hypothetical protein